MKSAYTKITTIITIVALLFLYGAVIVFATPPTSQYYPSEILDPTCGPGDLNCSVTVGWEFDTGNNYIYNTTDSVGIGTSTPDVEFEVIGDTQLEADLASGGLSYIYNGDLTGLGGQEGFQAIVIDSLTPTASGILRLDLETDTPSFSVSVNDGTNLAYILMDSDDGKIEIDSTTEIELDALTLLNVDAGADIDIDAADNIDISALTGDIDIDAAVSIDHSVTKADITAGSTIDPSGYTNIYVDDEGDDGSYGISFHSSDTTGTYIGHTRTTPTIADRATYYWDDSIRDRYVTSVGASSSDYITNDAILSTTGWSFEYQNGYGTLAQVTEGQFDINDSISFTSDTGGLVFSVDEDGDIYSQVLEGGSTTLSVDASGNIIRTPSDEKLKTDIEELDDSLERVMQLNPVSYSWKDKERFGEQIEIGFIAQEIEEVVPEVVRSGGEYKSVNYQILTALNAGAIKELAGQLSDRAVKLINDVKEIFVKKVTTEELCIGDICFDEEEAEILKEIISDGDYDFEKEDDKQDDNESEDEENDEAETEEVEGEIEEDSENEEESDEEQDEEETVEEVQDNDEEESVDSEETVEEKVEESQEDEETVEEEAPEEVGEE